MKKDQMNFLNDVVLYMTIFQLLIVLFSVHQLLEDTNDREVIVLLVITLSTLLFRILLVRFSYLDSIIFYRMSKLIGILILGTVLFNKNLFVEAVYFVLMTANVLELIIITVPDVPRRKLKLALMLSVTFVMAFIFSIFIHGFSIEIMFVYIIYVTFVMGSIYFSSYFILIKFLEVATLRRKIKGHLYEKETLELEKSKYQHLLSVVETQKNELEQSNIVLNRISAEMYTQAELMLYISSVLELDELTHLVTDSVIGAIGVDTCMIFIYDRDSGKQYVSVNTSIGKDLTQDFRDALSKGFYATYFEEGDPIMDADVIEEKYPFIKEREVGSLIVFPLKRKEVTYGLLIAEHHQKEVFDTNSLNFFKSISSQISIAVNNANIYMRMEEMAIIDDLSGLYNRREIQRCLTDAFYNNKKNASTSLALFDIDRFKKINDTYGHQFGDEMIKAIANISKDFASEYDFICGRYGGEEFIFIMPNTSLEKAYTLMKDFHDRIMKITLIYDDKEEVNINVSIGVSVYPDLAEDPDSLLRRTDNAMYYAKENGRGQVIMDSTDIEKVI